MMIEITVRTLDSQNHKFSVDDEYTVLQFKQHIASTVKIAAETQRIIYSGRVLTDDAKLSELDVNGKVVHLVERPPPSDNQSNNVQPNRTPNTLPPQAPTRVLGGNAMYLGSMAFPIEPQNLVPPPANFRLAASRLAVARRMLRRAEATIAWLENPTAPRPANPPNDEVSVDVTPVFEARVIVPAAPGENIHENLMNAVQSSLMNNAENVASNSTMDQATETAPQESSVDPEGTQSSESTTPISQSTPLSTSVEDIPGAGNSAGPTNQATNGASTTQDTSNISRTYEMADLLDTLNRLQVRFAPFLERYRNFMREDPEIEPSDGRSTDRTFSRISEVMHYFSHAYHSLSDMIVRARNPPPRRLVCRPILIQQTALVPAGFPIQVEAQINFSSDMPMPNSTTSATQTAGDNVRPNATSATSTAANTTGSTTATGANGQGRTSRVSLPHFEFMNFPGLPPGLTPSAIHVQSVPLGIRTMRSSSAPRQGSTAATQSQSQNQNGAQNAQNAGIATNGQQQPQQQQGANANNPNVEFFMEVTPESITIDSLETSLLGGNQGAARGGAMPQPTPEFLQSIMQMAGQLVNRGASTSNHFVIRPSATAADATSSSSTQPSAPGQNGVPGQNSQARGNTQTNPTTATHTRSTARPHVHFSQHAIQGFDPFLPCNSHHIVLPNSRRSARNATNNNQNQPNNNNVRPQNGSTPNQVHPVLNLLQGVLGSLGNIMPNRGATQSTGVQSSSSTPASTTTGSAPAPSIRNLPQTLQSLFGSSLLPGMSPFQMPTNNDPNFRGLTIAEFFEQIGEQLTSDGIFGDMLVVFATNFTIGDMMALVNGRIDPILRIRNEIRAFVNDRILEGNQPTPQNIDRAINKILNDMQPFLDSLSSLPVRDDIDLSRSIQLLLRTRLPNLIKLAVSRRTSLMSDYRWLIDQLRLTIKHMFALIVHASSNGQRGVEDFMANQVTTYVAEIVPGMLQWARMETLDYLREYLNSIDVPLSALQPYIVKNVNSVLAQTEPMEIDNEVATATEEEAVSNVLGVIELNDGEEIPAVVIGSENWHGQVPQDWVPLIARDTQRQRRQSQAPLSDAYLSGMPSKRRKVVTGNKPQGTLPQVISESLRRAVTSTGNAQAANLDTVVEEASTDLTIQAAYRDLLRTSVQTSIQDNEDFTPERFPNASSYFSKSQ